MTTTLDPLLHAVLSRHDDDLPRLVYADALEEAGDGERAEFIRGHVSRRLGPFTADYGRAITFSYVQDINFYVRAGEVGSVVAAPAIPEVSWSVSRGFVSSVRCSLAAWCGEACGRCLGRGRNDYRSDIDGRGIMALPCTACHGTRRTPGHGPKIVAKHPVTQVEFTDAQPAPSSAHAGMFRFYTDTFPYSIYDLLADGADGIVMGAQQYWHSQESALAALSAAAIRWARAEAVRRGLVPDVWNLKGG